MKLSMSMLRWYLREYQPRDSIRNDQMTIKGIRFLSEDDTNLSTEYVYFGSASNFFSDKNYQNAYIIVSGQSRLMFFNCDYERLLNSLLGAFDYFISWENRLLEASSRHAPIQELAGIAVEVIENTLAVDDVATFRVFVSIESYKAKYDPYWAKLSSGEVLANPLSTQPMLAMDNQVILNFTDKPQLLQNFHPGSDPVMMMYIYTDAEPVAVLAVRQDDPELTQMNEQLFPLLGRYFSQAAEFTSADSELRSGGSLLRDLLLGHTIAPEAKQRFVQYKLSPPYRLIAFQHETRQDLLGTAGILKYIQQSKTEAIALEYKTQIVCLLRKDDANHLLDQLVHGFDLSHHLVGVSMPIWELDGVSTGYQQAVFSLEQLQGRPGISRCEDYAFAYLIGSLRNLPFAKDLLHPAITLLKQYDRKNQSELLQTLSVYLAHAQNQSVTASTLHIHLNTLKYRLRKIREITGLSLADENEVKYLQLSDWLCEYDS